MCAGHGAQRRGRPSHSKAANENYKIHLAFVTSRGLIYA